MKQISAEDIVMNLVCNGGDCRSKALQAIRTARAGNIAEAETLLEEAQKSLQAAHHFQTDLIQSEMQEDGEPVEDVVRIGEFGHIHIASGKGRLYPLPGQDEQYQLYFQCLNKIG